MTKLDFNENMENIKEILLDDRDYLKDLVKKALQEILESEMEETLKASKFERNEDRIAYRSGYYSRNLITRVGMIELRIPQDRKGLFSTEVFERYQRSEKALVTSLMEMYVNGVSTRKVRKITEELCGYSFSAGTVSNLNKKLDKQLNAFANRPLEEEYPYLILDANYKKIRENGIVRSQAIMTAVGVNWEGRRQIIGIELANRETKSSWKEFIIKLKERGLKGVDFVVSDNHEGLKSAISELLPSSIWQRCYVHFLRNALNLLPRKKTVDDVLLELRWIYDRSCLNEAKKALDAWLEKWGKRYPKLCDWVEDNIFETLNFYALPRQHHKNMKSSNVIERINEEFKRRALVIRIFPNPESCLRIIRAVSVELQESWMERSQYINMLYYKEMKKTKELEDISKLNEEVV